MATTYMGQMLAWYTNPFFNPMIMEVPQLGTQMAPILIPQDTLPLMMVMSVGTLSQNSMDASAATITERNKHVKIGCIFPQFFSRPYC